AEDFFVIACINHWDKAIETHKKNHPWCLHLQEDFRNADLHLIQYIIAEIRKRNPDVTIHLWLSLECTNFSNAKGGMSREADSRTLADYAPRYLHELNPDVIWIENVKEFMLWGPMLPKVIAELNGKRHNVFTPAGKNEDEYLHLLLQNGYAVYSKLVINKKNHSVTPWMIPDPNRKGEDFERWVDEMCSYGYDCDRKLMNCADFEVPQHRIRLIIQFTRNGIPATWPVPSNSKRGINNLPKWLPVKDCLDLEDEGEDVLSFKTMKKTGSLVPRIKSPKTIKRLMNGCIKFVLTGKRKWIVKTNSAKNNTDVSSGASIQESSSAITCFNGLNIATALKAEDCFIVKYNSTNQKTGTHHGNDINNPSAVITPQVRLAIAKAHLVDYYFGNGYSKPVDETANVSGTKDGCSLHTVQYLATYHSQGQGTSVENPSPSQMTKDKTPLVSAKFLSQHYSNDGNSKNIGTDAPSRAITATGGNLSVVNTYFLDHQFTEGQQNKSIDDAAGAIQTVPKQKLVEVDHFVMDTQFNNAPHDIDDTARTITANRKHYYIVSAQFNNVGSPIENPSATIISRMDKKPNYLVVLETGELALEIYKHDPPHYIAMKRFMADHGIVKISMRMLKEIELLKIMTLPNDYKMTRSSTDNKKMIGNAVPPKLVKALANAYNKSNTISKKEIA
ncbi:MAG TPA: DNA cytosine methyltransferase, partial [Chitinophagaceae bacterium]|nr:DNA cytosine methyltransferase [Chitinophagaceae bacterium]